MTDDVLAKIWPKHLPDAKSEACTVPASLFSEHHSVSRLHSGATVSTTNSTSFNLGSNPGCCGGKPHVLQHSQSSVSQHNLTLVYMLPVICSSY